MDTKTDMRTKLGTEKIGRLLVQLAIPTLTAQLVNMLYNIVDRIDIGRIPGEGALALTGLGLCVPVLMLVTAFANLIGMGGAPRASIEMGRKNMEGAEQILGNCFATLVGLALVLTVLFRAGARPMLFLFGASENTIGYALDYLNIYILGSISVMLSLGLNAFITTQGFSRISMLTVMIGAVINIVLDPVFIFVFHMGVKGAALATILSQTVSALWVLRFLTGKKTLLRIKKKNLRVQLSVLLPVLALGMGTFVMVSTESLLSVVFNSSLQKYGGDLAVGAMTILSSSMQICNMPILGLTQGAQPITSYNYGAGKMERVKATFRLLFLSSMGYTSAMWLLMILAPQVLPSLFTRDPALLSYASWAIRIYMGMIFVFGAQLACQQTFVALDQAKSSLFLALFRKVLVLIPLIYLLPMFLEDKVFAVFLAEPIADTLAALVTTLMFFFQFRRITK